MCRSAKITGLPSVYAFYGDAQPVKFHEERTRKNFVKFVKRYIPANVVDIWAGNFDEEIQNPERKNHPWVIYFYGKNDQTFETKILHSLGEFLEF